MTGSLTVGNITIGGASGTTAGKTVASNDTLYVNRKANTSLIFQLGGTEHARFDTSGNLIPASGNTSTIGTQARPWTAMYATTFYGNATSADQLNYSLNFSFDGTAACEYDGSAMTGTYADADGNTAIDITPQLINAVDIDGTSTMTGTLKIDDVDGIKVNSHNKDLKIWEVVGNAGSWNSQFGFYDLYKGTGSGNDNSLELYADNQSGTHVKVRTIKQDGTVNWHTVNTFDQTIVGNIDTADKVNHSLNISFDSISLFEYDGSELTGVYADENGNSLLDITPEAINAVRRNGDTIPGPLTINGVTTVNNDMYIDSATVGDLLVNGGTRFVGDVNAGNVTASQFTGPLAGNATSADVVNHSLKISYNGTEQCSFNGAELLPANGGDTNGNTVIDINPEAILAAPAINGVYYGVCNTAKDTKQKEVTLTNGTGFQLVEGAIVMVKFVNGAASASAADPMTLNVNNTGAKTMYCYNTTLMSNGINTSGWQPNAVVQFVYDGTAWYRVYWNNTEYTVASAFCSTSSTIAAKTTTNETLFKLEPYSIIPIMMYYENTYAGPITLNIRNTGAKPIYINGQPSSATNYTLPAGKYLIYYDGTNYYFQTNNITAYANYIKSSRFGTLQQRVSGTYTYYKIASFNINSTGSVIGSRGYKAYYRITPMGNLLDPSDIKFVFILRVVTDSNGNSTIETTSGSYLLAGNVNNSRLHVAYCLSTDKKTAEIYVRTYGNNATLFDVNLEKLYSFPVDDPPPATYCWSALTDPQLLYTANVVENGWTFNFLLPSSTASCSLLTPTTYAINDNSTVGYSNYLKWWKLADTATYEYYLGAVSATANGVYTGAYYNPHSYIKSGELYQNSTLHINNLVGTTNTTFGTTLPSSPTAGQLFFQIDAGSSGGSSGGSLSIAQKTSGTMYVLGYDGSDNTKAYYNSSVYVDCSNGVLRGAAWNDYAEGRKQNIEEQDIQKPGCCVKENGDGTLSLTTKRLERGCEIISDTYGMIIGQDCNHKTPIAVSGRVLAYPYESIEEFKNHIGYPVCSGPNGTVSIMTDMEEHDYPSRIIGTISEIPDYDIWGQNNVYVDGRVWIRIK